MRDGTVEPLERFVFAFDVGQPGAPPAVPYAELEYLLQAHVTKLSAAESLLRPVQEGCSWEIVAYTETLPGTLSPQSRLWIPAEACDFPAAPIIHPIKSGNCRNMKLQVLLEQRCI